MKLNSHNEWDTLKTVIVGTVEGFSPALEWAKDVPEESFEKAQQLVSKAYPSWYLEEVAEDLEGLCEIFRKAGATVLRPKWSEACSRFATPNWQGMGFDIYNVRDLHIVFGDKLVVSASAAKFRMFERYALQDLFYEHFFDDGFQWITAPLPRLRGQYVHEIKRETSSLEKKEDAMHKQLSGGLSEIYHRLDEDEILFDAANIMRLDNDILFLVSSTANRKAVRWLSDVLGDDYNVHETHAYRSSHLDSTILPLNRGCVLMNGARVSEDTCPDVCKQWDKIFFTDVAPLPEEEISFHRDVRVPIHNELKELGFDSLVGSLSSPWAGLNVMSLNPSTVLVHDRQEGLMRVLESKGFTVVPVRMRHCYSILGSLHCSTLDVVRSAS